jgi:sterol desaturase/sphingolipid hydroxylase (fatty acid hydroxylase superfamily)
MPEWILRNGEAIQVELFFTLLAVLAVLETFLARRPGPMERRMRWPANLFLTFVNFLALGAIPLSLLTAAAWAQSQGWGLFNVLSLPVWLVVVLTLLVRGFISFSTHYLMHHVPLFWRLHRVHHLDTELDVTTTVRFHPLEFVVQTLPGVPIVVGFGLPPWVLVAYEILDVAVTLWTHSNVRLPAALDRIVRYVVATPDLHRIHHSAWEPETNSNFGAVFPVWDLVFGTFRATPREPHEQMRLGLDEVRGPDAHRPIWLLGSFLRARLQPPLSRPRDRERRSA